MIEQKRLENHKIYYIGAAELPLRTSPSMEVPLLLAITKQAFGSFPCSKLNVSDCRYSAITEGF